MIRAFTVITMNKNLIESIGIKLDKKLCELQENGWHICNVEKVNCKSYDYRDGNFENTAFVIVAKKDEPNVRSLSVPDGVPGRDRPGRVV